MADRYRCVLFFGAPGVGKGTQGGRLGEGNGFVHLATGDIFRSLDEDSESGKQFLHYSSRGELVPDDLTVRLWKQHVERMIKDRKYDPASHILLLDGIPRSVAQSEMLEEYIEPLRILHLVATDLDKMVERMKDRAEKQGRHDDADEDVIRRRFQVYDDQTTPVLDHYDTAIIHRIDAMGTIDEVADLVREAVRDVHAPTPRQ